MSRYVLTLTCADRPGIVHAVAGVIAQTAGNITESAQFDDAGSGRFLMRVEWESDAGLDGLRERFGPVADSFGMQWSLQLKDRPMRTLVMVSTAGHCLNDLLFRRRAGQLPIEIPVIVSNHERLAELAAFYGIGFQHIPVTPATRQEAEDRLRELVAEHEIELVVLARYMQILSDDLCRDLQGRAINIHHSFLPSFKGARPYHQAFDRGVKIIGATAHYVTSDLDEGPIIEQDIARVDHTASAETMRTLGQDVEAQVLSRAVRWHAEHRVLRNGNRTVVFR